MNDEITVGSRWTGNINRQVVVVRHIEEDQICYATEAVPALYVAREVIFREAYSPLPIITGPGWYVRRDGYPAAVIGPRPLEQNRWVTESHGGVSDWHRDDGRIGGWAATKSDIIARWPGEPPTSFDERRVT